MRVPNISTYVNSTHRLGALTSKLEDANEISSTQKRINEISDDPLGLSQVISLKSTLDNLDQINRNVNIGKSWVESVENSISNINDLILEIKTDAIQLANDSMTADIRNDAIGRVESVIEQIITLGNTQINGNYIFSGTDSDIIPLEYDTKSNRVIYKGNEIPFEIRTDKSLGVEVGRNGQNTFWDQEIKIGSNNTNNTIVFKEDNGHGDAFVKVLSATIPDGMYSKENIETAIKNAVNDISAKQGYGLTYIVDYDEESQKYLIREDGTYSGYMKTEFMWETGKDAYINNISSSDNIPPEDINITIVDQDALTTALTTDTPELAGTKPLKLMWEGSGKLRVVNNPGYTITPSTIEGTVDSVGIDLNGSGTADITINLDNVVMNSSDYIEFEIVAAKDDHSIGHEIGFNADNLILSPPVSDSKVQSFTNLVINGTNNKLDFMEIIPDGEGRSSGKLTAVIDSKTYTSHFELAREVEEAMELESRYNGNSVDYSVSWDDYTEKFTIKESGTNLSELHLMWRSGDNAPLAQGGTGESIGSILGFSANADDIAKPMESSRIVEWGVFNTLIDLKQYLSNNDRDGIERAIGRLETNYDNMTSRIVDAGMKFSRLEVRETIISNISLSLTQRRSNIEDADIIKSIMDLKNIETAYQAALSSTAKVLDISLVDYLR